MNPFMKKKKLVKEEQNIRELLGITAIKKGIVETSHSYTLVFEVLPINVKLKSKREQKFITKKYEELHKAFKSDFDVRTISKREDLRTHLEYVSKLYQNEKNDNVKEMIKEYQSLVTDVAYKQAVRRRFIVYITYPVPPGFSFESIHREDAERWLLEKGMIFAEHIAECGNEVVVPDNTDQFVTQIVFELLNRKTSEKERVPRL